MLTPETSRIRQIFLKQSLPGISLNNGHAPLHNRSPDFQTLELDSGVLPSFIAFAPNGERLLFGTRRGELFIWDIANGSSREVALREYDRYTLFAISPDGKMVAVGFQNGDIQVLHLDGDQPFEVLKGHLRSVEAIVFSDERTIKSISTDGTIRIWDITTKSHVAIIIQDFVSPSPGGGFILSPDGQMFAFLANSVPTPGFANDARIYNATNGSFITTLKHGWFIDDCAFSNDGAKFATVSEVGITVWDINRSQPLQTMNPCFSASSIRFSPDSRIIASVSIHNGIALWDVSNGSMLNSFQGHEITEPIAFSQDGRHLASGSHNPCMFTWSLVSSSAPTAADKSLGGVSGVFNSSTGDVFAVASFHKDMRIWNMRTKAGPQALKSPIGDIFEIEFSPDGSKLLISSLRGQIYIGEATNGQFRCLWSRNISDDEQGTDMKHVPVTAVRFTPDGRKFVTVTGQRKLDIWDTASETRLHTSHLEDGVDSISISPDGSKIALLSFQTIIIWDMIEHTCLSRFDTFIILHPTLFFSKCSRYVAASSAFRNSVLVWDCVMHCCVFMENDYPLILASAAMITTDGSLVGIGPDANKPTPSKYISCSGNMRWIVRDGLPVVWLPPEYRDPNLLRVTDSAVAVGSRSEDVLIFSFDDTAL